MTDKLAQFAADGATLIREAIAAFDAATTPEALESARIQFLGDRSGRLKSLQQALGAVPKEDKPNAGKMFNTTKTALTEAFEERLLQVRNRAESGSGTVDLTMPARQQWRG